MSAKIFCPQCGAPSADPQSYCRSCGLGLKTIKSAMNVETSAEGDGDLLTQTIHEGEHRYVKAGLAALMVFGLGFVALMFYLVIDKKLFAQGRYVEGIIFLIMMLAGLGAAGLFARANLSKGRASHSPDGPADEIATTAKTEKLLADRQFEPLPSVVEKTTDLLEINAVRGNAPDSEKDINT